MYFDVPKILLGIWPSVRYRKDLILGFEKYVLYFIGGDMSV